MIKTLAASVGSAIFFQCRTSNSHGRRRVPWLCSMYGSGEVEELLPCTLLYLAHQEIRLYLHSLSTVHWLHKAESRHFFSGESAIATPPTPIHQNCAGPMP